MSVRLLLLSSVALLAACGQKGPLYLPDKNPKVITSAAPEPGPAPAPAATPAPDGSTAQPSEKPPDKKDGTESPK
jgi:predicted small lipoprotein YifL